MNVEQLAAFERATITALIASKQTEPITKTHVDAYFERPVTIEGTTQLLTSDAERWAIVAYGTKVEHPWSAATGCCQCGEKWDFANSQCSKYGSREALVGLWKPCALGGHRYPGKAGICVECGARWIEPPGNVRNLDWPSAEALLGHLKYGLLPAAFGPECHSPIDAVKYIPHEYEPPRDGFFAQIKVGTKILGASYGPDRLTALLLAIVTYRK